MRPGAVELLRELAPDLGGPPPPPAAAPLPPFGGSGGDSRSLRELFRETMSSGRSFHSMSGRLFWKEREEGAGDGEAEWLTGGVGLLILALLEGALANGGGAVAPEKPERFTAAAVVLVVIGGAACGTAIPVGGT